MSAILKALLPCPVKVPYKPTHICKDDGLSGWTQEARAKAQAGAKAARAKKLGISKQALEDRLKRVLCAERAFSVARTGRGVSNKKVGNGR